MAAVGSEDGPKGAVAVRRALAVLACFGEGELDKRLTDIARQTGLTASTAHRLVSGLVADGFLTQSPDTERYRLGPMLVLLGQRGARQAGLHEAQAVLDRLMATTGESATLAVRASGEVVVIASAPSPQRLRFEHGIGSRIAVHASGMGKVLLAAEPDPASTVQSLGELERFTDHTIVSARKLVSELKAVHANGWAVNREERYDGVVGVAAPVLSDGGRVVAAIGVQGPVTRLPLAADGPIVAAVVEAARGLSGRFDSNLTI